MTISITDTHAHLTSVQMLPQIEEVLQRALENGVKRIINICTDIPSLEQGLLLHEKHPWVHNTAATTPHDVETEGEEFFPFVEHAAASGKLVAIGETGLDSFYTHSDKKVQQAFLLRYFALARRLKLPLVFHCRDAFADLFAMADSEYSGAPAVLHCFTGTLEEAKGVLDRGWFVSISGIATFKKSEVLREVIRYVPLDRLFVETDSPWLAPQRHRGEQNEPSFVVETLELVAAIKGASVTGAAQQLEANVGRFFSFSKVK